nr:uncharacterized protein LOC124814819 [Hydra vulgaris]
MLKVCEGRKGKWVLDVKSRLNCCFNLVVSDSIYHFECYKLFSTNRESNLSKTEKPGCKENSTMAENFERLCGWFESQMVPVTTSELHNKMEELVNSEEIYSMKHLNRKSEEKYKHNIIISQTEDVSQK